MDSSLVSRAALLRKEPNSASLVPAVDDELGYEADSESSPDDYAASEGMLSVSREGGEHKKHANMCSVCCADIYYVFVCLFIYLFIFRYCNPLATLAEEWLHSKTEHVRKQCCSRHK